MNEMNFPARFIISRRYSVRILLVICTASFFLRCVDNADQQGDGFQSQVIFPYQDEHVHGSTIVELPNGDLLTAWFQGSGERWADDVRIMGSRLRNNETEWSEPFLMADVPGFPDINPILFLDTQQRLWLMWYPVLANQWETSIPMFRLSEEYSSPGPPAWSWQDVLFVKAGDKTERGIQPDDLFVRQVSNQLLLYEEYLMTELKSSVPDSSWESLHSVWNDYKVKMDSLSKGMNMIRSGRVRVGDEEQPADLGYPLTRRLGWQTKNKAVMVENRIIVPLYSDGFDCSLFALTDDFGANWKFSNPVLGGAGIQPTLLISKNGCLAAYLRDNGPPPQRMQRTESCDNGLTWSIPKDDVLPNPGAGFDAVTLLGGEWLMVFNDSERDRSDLSVAVSDDEGKSWKWKKSIEHDIRDTEATRSHYPSVIAGANGTIHISYSYHRNDTTPGRSVKYCALTLDWIKTP